VTRNDFITQTAARVRIALAARSRAQVDTDAMELPSAFDAVQAAAARRIGHAKPSTWLPQVARAIVAQADDADDARRRVRLFADALFDAVNVEMARDKARDARRAGL
jgi:hypothetical protein